jgi:hypothetical protein
MFLLPVRKTKNMTFFHESRQCGKKDFGLLLRELLFRVQATKICVACAAAAL